MEEIEINWKVGVVIFLMIITYLFGYIHHKFTNDDSRLVKEYKANFLKCSAECKFDSKIGYITQIDNIHYRCICLEEKNEFE